MKTVLALAGALAFLAIGSTARAQVVDDPLHGECVGGCAEAVIGGNAVTPITSPTNFGFSSSPPGATGNLQLKFLIPNSFTLTQVNAFASAVGVVSGTGQTYPLNLFSTTAWTSGFLETDYLHNTLANGAPKNPLDAFIGATNFVLTNDATGYYVLTANTGQHTLDGPGAALTAANTFSLDPAFFAQGGLILGNVFQADGTVISTAQSGALFNGQPSSGPFCPDCTPTPTAVPGPTMGAGAAPILAGMFFAWYRSRRRQTV